MTYSEPYDTELLQINDKSLNLAKEYILGGELVGFPTETVYGLGAIAYSDEAVKKIFEAKGRPSDNPLIVHVHKITTLINSSAWNTTTCINSARRFCPVR